MKYLQELEAKHPFNGHPQLDCDLLGKRERDMWREACAEVDRLRAAVERETAQLRAEIKMLEGGPMTESIATPKQLASKIIDVIDGENGALKLGKEQARKLGFIFLHEERRKTREYAAKLTAAEGTVAQLRTRLDTAREALEYIADEGKG